jgi:hypothetical protein
MSEIAKMNRMLELEDALVEAEARALKAEAELADMRNSGEWLKTEDIDRLQDAEARAIKAEAALRNVRLMLFENPSHVAAIRGALTIIETALDKQEGE